MKKRIIWKNFLRLTVVAIVVVILSSGFMYQNTLSVIQKQFCVANENNIALMEANLEAVLKQAERLAATLSVEDDSRIFFGVDRTEAYDEELCARIYMKLKSYTYSMDYISSIVLYAPEYGKIISSFTEKDYKIEKIDDATIDTGWLEIVSDMENGAKVDMQIRAVNDRYPYVWTFIAGYQTQAWKGNVIINLDLKRLYDTVWVSKNEETKVWILNENGQIVIRKDKQELFEDRDNEGELAVFRTDKKEWSQLLTKQGVPRVFSQKYNEKYGLYFAASSSMQDYQQQIHDFQVKILAMMFAGLLVLSILILIHCTVSYRPFKSIMNLLESPEEWVKNQPASKDEISEISDKILFYLQTNDDLRQEMDKRMDALRQTQVKALQAQLDPHFVFNTLDAIWMMIEEKEGPDAQAIKMCTSLAAILRYSLAGGGVVPLKKELEYMEKYCFILKCRYRDSFKVTFNFEENMLQASVPQLILQPLIENAVFHGIAARTEDAGGELIVQGWIEECESAQVMEKKTFIQIMDNGYGMSQEEIKRIESSITDEEHVKWNHIGVQNVAKRMALLFPNQSQLKISSELKVGTCITLTFPMIEMKEDAKEGQEDKEGEM